MLHCSIVACLNPSSEVLRVRPYWLICPHASCLLLSLTEGSRNGDPYGLKPMSSGMCLILYCAHQLLVTISPSSSNTAPGFVQEGVMRATGLREFLSQAARRCLMSEGWGSQRVVMQIPGRLLRGDCWASSLCSLRFPRRTSAYQQQ